MKSIQTLRYDLDPDGEQEQQIYKFVRACQFVFNKALTLQKLRYEQGLELLGRGSLRQLMDGWRAEKESIWLMDVPAALLRQTLYDLERACTAVVQERADFPRFKTSGDSLSLWRPDPKKIRQDLISRSLFLPELGWVPYRNYGEELPRKIRRAEVGQSDGAWCVLIHVDCRGDTLAPSVYGKRTARDCFAMVSDGPYHVPHARPRPARLRCSRLHWLESGGQKPDNRRKKLKGRGKKVRERKLRNSLLKDGAIPLVVNVASVGWCDGG